MRDQSAVGVDPFLDIGQIAAVDDAVQALGPADEHTGFAAGQRVGDQFPGRLVAGMSAEQFDVAGGVGEQQLGIAWDRPVARPWTKRQNSVSRSPGPWYHRPRRAARPRFQFR